MAIRVDFTPALAAADAADQSSQSAAQTVCAQAVQNAAAAYDGTANL
jgi:hypothetical protein